MELTDFLNEKFSKSKQITKHSIGVVSTLCYSMIDEISLDISVNEQSAFKVHNPTLYAAFLLRQKEYQIKGINFTIMTMFHSTPTSCVESILKEKFDRRLNIRHRYGSGEYHMFNLDVEFKSFHK
jgi:hypothetical protein